MVRCGLPSPGRPRRARAGGRRPIRASRKAGRWSGRSSYAASARSRSTMTLSATDGSRRSRARPRQALRETGLPRESVGSSQWTAIGRSAARCTAAPGVRARRDHSAAVVREPRGAALGELDHLGQLGPLLRLRDGGEEPDGHLRLLLRALDESRGPRLSRRPAGVGHGQDRVQYLPAAAARVPEPRDLPRPRGRAFAGGREGRRTPARAPWPLPPEAASTPRSGRARP